MLGGLWFVLAYGVFIASHSANVVQVAVRYNFQGSQGCFLISSHVGSGHVVDTNGNKVFFSFLTEFLRWTHLD